MSDKQVLKDATDEINLERSNGSENFLAKLNQNDRICNDYNEPDKKSQSNINAHQDIVPLLNNKIKKNPDSSEESFMSILDTSPIKLSVQVIDDENNSGNKNLPTSVSKTELFIQNQDVKQKNQICTDLQINSLTFDLQDRIRLQLLEAECRKLIEMNYSGYFRDRRGSCKGFVV